MSPRRNRPKGAGSYGRGAEDDRPRYGGHQYTESWQGEEFTVRQVAGSGGPGKTYRCPGCDQEIRSSVPHVVAWPEHGAGVEDRRHWHKACWNARDRRTTRVQRSRNAPKF
ncbi:ATP/GTP-binding protein [Streptomyces sp. Da 82-17]|uniref:ATP/GTP-binding protein n=1 Tax=Streptomyces sp. Da 82-17 TaxID=3377116 RepID=UPI0038D4C700